MLDLGHHVTLPDESQANLSSFAACPLKNSEHFSVFIGLTTDKRSCLSRAHVIRRRSRHSYQRSFDELGRPLSDVTFCVVDLETTGSNRADDLITEVGAVKVRGGEVLGTFQTLVNPGRAIPPKITILTGLSDALVARAPRIETVLPALLEFMGDTESGQTVIVGHNVGFDVAFIRAALERAQRPRLEGTIIDTVALARRLVRDEVPNCKLGTLAERLTFGTSSRATGHLTTHGRLRICCTS